MVMHEPQVVSRQWPEHRQVDTGSSMPEPVGQWRGVYLAIVGQVESDAFGALNLWQAFESPTEALAGEPTLFVREVTSSMAKLTAQGLA